MHTAKHIRFLTFVLGLVLMLSVLAAVPATAATGADGANTPDTSYRRKVISVVYDNSGSMSAQDRIHYAKYSLQILLSMLSKGDVLTVVPMNASSGETVIEVNMGDGDCSKAIQDIVSKNAIKSASGGTPFKSVSTAVEQLVERGLKTVEQAGDASGNEEYWLVILTDGEFDTASTASALENAIAAEINKYSSLRTIYLGIGGSATDLSGCGLTRSAPFTAMKAGEKALFVEKMQAICNLMSGRYSLDEKSYAVSGNRVVLDFDRTDFPFRTLSILLQDCAATIQNVSYNGKSLTAVKSGTVAGAREVAMADGVFAVLEGAPYFSGGRLELTFSAPVDANKLTLMGEPALTITPYFEYKGASGWQRTDIRYINSNLTQNDRVRVGYEIFEQSAGRKLDLKSIFGSVDSRVTYASHSYAVGDEIPLVVGMNEIGISVSVMNGNYSLNTSVMCVISENPTFYRIESKVTEKHDQGGNQALVDFVVYSDNKPLTKSQLAGYTTDLHFYRADGSELAAKVTQANDGTITAELDLTSFPPGEVCTGVLRVVSPLSVSREKRVEIVVSARLSELNASVAGSSDMRLTQAELLDNTAGFDFAVSVNGKPGDFADAVHVAYSVELNGRDVTAHTTVSDGRLKFVPTLGNMGEEAGRPGNKTVTVTVWSVADPGMRSTASATLEVVQSTLVMTVTPGSGSFAITPFKLNGNTRGFTFTLTLDGKPVDPAGGLVDWKVAVDGADVSRYVGQRDGGLFFAPAADNLGSVMNGTRTVTATAGFRGIPSISASCSTQIDIVDSVWEIRLLPGAVTDINRFRIEESGAFARFMVLRDDVPLGRDELETLWNDGILTVSGATFDKNILLPVGREVTFEEQDGYGVLRYTVTRDQIQPVAGVMAMFIFNGEKIVHMSCYNAQLDTAFNFPPSSAWSYVWRILVILLIIYIAIYIAAWPRCKSFPSGLMVTLNISDTSVTCNRYKVNMTFAERYLWHIRRLLPWKLFSHQPENSFMFMTGDGTPRFKVRRMRPSGMTLERASDDNTFIAWEEFYEGLRSGRNNSNMLQELRKNIPRLRRVFRADGEGPIDENNAPIVSGGTFFIAKDKRRVLRRVTFFIFLNH